MGRQIHGIVLILLSICEVWMCYQVLYRTVLEKKYLRKWQKVLIWGNITVLGILMGINRKIIFFSTLMFAFSILVTWLCALGVERKNVLIKLQIIILYYTIFALLDFFFGFISMEVIGQRFFDDIYKFSQSIVQCVLYLISRVCIAVLLMKWDHHGWYRKDDRNVLVWLCIGGVALLRIYQKILGNMALGSILMRGWAAAVSMVLVAVLTSGVFIVSYRFKMLKKENEMLLNLEEMSKNHVKDLEQMIEKNRILTHDMKNHLIVLQEYGKKEKWDLLMSYLNEISDDLYWVTKATWTQVEILDMLLNQKKMKAESKGIAFHIKASTIGEVSITDTEICSLFGNLLDNAIEACEKIQYKKRWIEIRIMRKSKMLYITIANSIEEFPLVQEGKLITGKKEKQRHGYGLKSVQHVVRKYRGDFEYQICEKEFIVTIKFWKL